MKNPPLMLIVTVYQYRYYMTKYKEWMVLQDPEFIKLIHGDFEIPNVFKDNFNDKEISLDELEQLDNRYITPEEL